MSDPESLLKKIAEEEARLARIDKERDEALARLKDLRDRLISDLPVPTSPKPIPSEWLTSSERIRAASEIPFEVDLKDEDAIPAYMKISEKVLHLRRLGMSYTRIADRLGVNLWMAKKSAHWGKTSQ